MFGAELFTYEMLLALGVPLAFVGLITCLLGKYWRQRRREKPKEYVSSTFREPINAALSVAAFSVPLLCALVGYLVTTGVPARSLVCLYASTILFALSVVVGLWNMFSLTATDGDKIKIDGENMWLFPAQVVSQFLLISLGGAVLVVYLTFFLEVSAKPAAADAMPAHPYFIAKPPVDISMKKSDIIASWGTPAARFPEPDKGSGVEMLKYETTVSYIEFECMGDVIITRVEKRK